MNSNSVALVKYFELFLYYFKPTLFSFILFLVVAELNNKCWIGSFFLVVLFLKVSRALLPETTAWKAVIFWILLHLFSGGMLLTDWRGFKVTPTLPWGELKNSKPGLDNAVRVSHASNGKAVWLHVCVGWCCLCESSMWSIVWIILLLKRCRMKSLGPGRGRKSPADSHIERVQSPPAGSRDITIWSEA